LAQPHLRLATIDGEIARDEAIDQVLGAADPVWRRAVLDLIIYRVPLGWEGIFEEIRFMAEAAGLNAHKSEAWGGVCMAAIRLGLLVEKSPLTQERMKDPRSHARKSDVLQRTNFF
jgi:hypothetical protein